MTQQQARKGDVLDSIYVVVARNETETGTWIKDDRVYYTVEEAKNGLFDFPSALLSIAPLLWVDQNTNVLYWIERLTKHEDPIGYI